MTLACVIDIYSRKILYSGISNTLNTSSCVDATTEEGRLYGSPEFINTGQGFELPPGAFVAAVTASGARLSMDG